MGIARNIARLIPNGSGLLPNANIEAVAASKLTGTVALATQVSGTLPDGNAPSGSVIQVVQTKKTNPFSTNSTTFVDITGFSVSITPISTSNNILVFVMLQVSSNAGGWYGSRIRLIRNSTAIALGDADGSRTRATFDFAFNTSNASLITPMPMAWLDNPSSTSAVTYKCDIHSIQNTTVFVNRSSYDNPSDAYDTDVVSTITAMEIAA